MINRKLRSDVDRLWEEFWTGGITNPLTVIEQISFLMFTRLLDIRETMLEKRAQRSKAPLKEPFLFNKKQQRLRWKELREIGSGEELLARMRDEVFPFFRKLNGGSTFGEYMKRTSTPPSPAW